MTVPGVGVVTALTFRHTASSRNWEPLPLGIYKIAFGGFGDAGFGSGDLVQRGDSGNAPRVPIIVALLDWPAMRFANDDL